MMNLRLPNNSSMNPLTLGANLPPMVQGAKDASGLPVPGARYPFTLFTGGRPYAPLATSSWAFVPETLEGLLTKIKFRAGIDALTADVSLQIPNEYPILNILSGQRNIADNVMALIPVPAAGFVASNQFNFHVFDKPEGVIEVNYPLTPNSLVRFIFQSLVFDEALNSFRIAIANPGTSVFTCSIEIEGTLWTRQS